MLHLLYSPLDNYSGLALASGQAQLAVTHTADDALVHQLLDVRPPVAGHTING